MADPATQFQAAGLNVPYSFQPTVANLGGSHLFGGAGELWAQVGATAMNAANMLQRSALNPQVRAQMQEAVQRAHLGTQVTKWVQAHPHWARAVTAETPEGATTVAPITQPVAQQAAENIDWNQDGEQQQKQQQQQQPTITRTGANTGVDQNGKQYHETTAGSNQWIAGKPAPIPPENLNTGMAQGGLVRGYATGGVTDKSGGSSDSADRDALIGRMIAERQAAGIPDTFQPQPPAQLHPAVQPQGGSIWTPQRPSPVAPPPAPAPAQAAPQPGQGPQMTLGATAQPPPGMELAGTEQAFPQRPSQQDQAALASWQARNAHPVMASSDALDWAKLFDTGVQRATYLQHGGPNGEPAYAFHMKGGGINTVPISQIVKNGGAASVAGQNTSATLSASDALMNQPPGQEPGMTLGATAQVPPGMQLGQPQPGQAQQAGPPAAPGPITPMPSGTGAGAAQGVPADSTAYNPAAYQMPQGPTITQTGEVNPALMAGGSDKQAAAAAAAAKAAAKPGTGTEVDVQTPPDQVAKMNADAASNNPNLDWKKDENGKKYIGNQDPQHPFWEQRFYPLSGGFQTGPWTAENIRKQQLLEEFGGPGGVPIKDKEGKPMVINADTINGLSPDEQDRWLAYARDYKLHTKYPLPTSDEGQNLAYAANAVQAAQRIKDKILYLKANNIPMDAISQDELIRSQEAGWAKSAPFPWAGFAMGGPPNNFADELRGDYKNLNSYLAKVKGGHYPSSTDNTPKPEEWGIPATDWTPPMGFPKGTSVSTIPALARISAGDDYDQALAHIQEVLDNATTDYKNAAKGLPKGEYRLPDVDQKNLYDLDNKGKGYIDDPTNLIWDKNHQKMVNGYGAVPYLTDKGWQTGGGPAKPSPTPVSLEVANAAPRPKTQDAYNAIPKGTLFWDRDGKLKPHP